MKYGGVQRIVLLALIISGCGKVGGADARETRNTAMVENSTAFTGAIAGRTSTPLVSVQGSENDAINKRTMTMLRTYLIGHATLDDEPIVNLIAHGSCASVLVTAKGRANIDWPKVGNLAPETINGRDVTAIVTADGPVKVAVPTGDTADRVSMGMGLLAENCEVRPDQS
jgi:hypothetical protein